MIPRKCLVLLLAATTLLVLGSASCRRKKKEAAGTTSPVVLQVGESYYFSPDFESYVRHTLGSFEESLSPTTLSRLFDRFIEDKLLLEKAREEQVSLTEEEMKEYLVRLKSQLDPEMETAFTEADLDSFRDKLLVDKYTSLLVKDIAVNEEELKAYYESHKSDFLQSERVEVSQILVESEEKAVAVLNSVRGKSAEEFQQEARKVSMGLEAERGGRMGIFSPGQLPFEIERVVLSLEEGQISQVVESSYGYHIFLLNRRFEPELVSLEKAAPGIRMKLLDQKISQALASHMEELKKQLNWKSMPQNLSFTYQRNLS